MSVLAPTAMTYAEWALRHDASGKLSTLVDMLSQTNGIVDDAMSVACQSGNAFEYTQVTSLPSATRRGYNQGVPGNVGGVAKLVSTCSNYGNWSFVDYDLAELNGDAAAFRFQEDAMHIEGINQQVASDLFYSNNTTDPTAFVGMSNIYNTVNTATSQIANNVIDCLGTGSDNSSMWLITWGPKQIHLIHPLGAPTGLNMKDMGQGWTLDGNQNQYVVWRTYLSWKLGLTIHDWRFAVRACNIDVSDLAGGGAANLINTLVRMVNKLPVQPVGVGPVQSTTKSVAPIAPMRSAIYVNRTIATYLDLQAMNKTNVLLKMEEWDGKSVTTFRGIPIRICDALTTSESRVV